MVSVRDPGIKVSGIPILVERSVAAGPPELGGNSTLSSTSVLRTDGLSRTKRCARDRIIWSAAQFDIVRLLVNSPSDPLRRATACAALIHSFSDATDWSMRPIPVSPSDFHQSSIWCPRPEHNGTSPDAGHRGWIDMGPSISPYCGEHLCEPARRADFWGCPHPIAGPRASHPPRSATSSKQTTNEAEQQKIKAHLTNARELCWCWLEWTSQHNVLPSPCWLSPQRHQRSYRYGYPILSRTHESGQSRGISAAEGRASSASATDRATLRSPQAGLAAVKAGIQSQGAEKAIDL